LTQLRGCAKLKSLYASRGIVCFAAAASACYTAVPKENVPCAENRACPTDQMCIAGVCRGSDFVPGDAPVDAASPAFALSGQRWLSPCTGPAGGGTLCPCAGSAQTQMVTLAGASTIYQVTVRIRGVVELAPYTGGSVTATDFYTGGAVNNTFANIYEISVSSPMAHYFINNSGATTGSGLVAIDYMAELPIAGDAVVTFTTNGQDSEEVANSNGLTVPGVTTNPQPYNGQFAQLDVISAM